MLLISSAHAQTNLRYQQPPKAIVDIVDALPTPGVELSPAGNTPGKRWMLIEHFAGLPTIADLAQPELRLAGLAIQPRGPMVPSRGRYSTSLELQALPNGKAIAISGLPAHAKIRFTDWSPDGRKICLGEHKRCEGGRGPQPLDRRCSDRSGAPLARNCSQRHFRFAVRMVKR